MKTIYNRPMAKRMAAALLCAGLMAGAAQAETARGTVFVDQNRNGVMDQGEKGLGGTRVSNGRAVVATKSDGSYAIDVRPGDVLYIIKPANYMTPVNESMLPQFHYVHEPEGTPEALNLRYEGVRPTGPLPGRIDFPLYPSPDPEKFSVVLFADPQPQTERELAYIRDDVISELVDSDAAFGITAGDIMFDDMSLFPRYNRLVAQIGLPWYNVPGNHELNFQSPDDARSLETFKRIFGPPNYSFDYGKAHFIVMDDVFYLGRGKGREEPHPRGAGAYEGRLTKEQLEWLRQDLSFVDEDKLVVLAMHIPLHQPLAPDNKSVNVLNRKDLFRILSKRRHVLSLAGHTHTVQHVYFGEADGFAKDRPLHHHTMATVSGSWWSGPRSAEGVPLGLQSDGVPNGYNILTVDGNRASIRYKAAGQPESHQMRVVLDTAFHLIGAAARRDYLQGAMLGSPITRDQVYSTDIIVNLFNGSALSKVTYEMAGREPVAMEQVIFPDPTSADMIERHKDSYKDWVKPWPTTHLWRARLPRDLGPGTHRITVRATDAYGAEHVAHKIVEITGHGGK